MDSLATSPELLSRDLLSQRDAGRNVTRTQDAFGAPQDDPLPLDPLAGPPRDGRSARDIAVSSSDRGRGVPKDPPPGVSRASMGPLGVLEDRRDDQRDDQSNRGERGDRTLNREGGAIAAKAKTTPDLAVSLDEEERELWRQLRRKSEFEMRVAEKRAQLAELRDQRRSVSAACADALASIENLQNQLDFARMHEKEIEHDIAVLRESNILLQSAFQAKKMRQEEAAADVKSGHLPHTLSEKERLKIRQEAREKASSIELKREQEAVMEYEQITHLRAHLERLVAEKSVLQQRQQALLDKQHSSEQDRNLLLSSLQEERKGINDLRHERLRLWEERHGMEREMTNIVQEAHFRVLQERSTQRYRGGVDPNIIAAEENAHIADPFAQEAVAGKSILLGGVRVPATLDTPAAFSSTAGEIFNSEPSGRKELANRKHWKSFAGDAVQNGSSVVDSGGVGFGLSALETPSGHGTGITEWAGRMQEYRTGGQRAN